MLNQLHVHIEENVARAEVKRFEIAFPKPSERENEFSESKLASRRLLVPIIGTLIFWLRAKWEIVGGGKQTTVSASVTVQID